MNRRRTVCWIAQRMDTPAIVSADRLLEAKRQGITTLQLLHTHVEMKAGLQFPGEYEEETFDELDGFADLDSQ